MLLNQKKQLQIISSPTKLINYLKNVHKAKNNIKIVQKNVAEAKRITFEKIEFKDFSLLGDFTNCKFIDCEFHNMTGFFLSLQKCQFINCRFENSRFTHFENIITDKSWDDVEFKKCFFKRVQFDEGDLYNIFFENCEFACINFSLENAINVNFLKCYVDESFFFSIKHDDKSKIYLNNEIHDLYFEECRINDTCFSGADLRKSIFWNTAIHKCSFIDCRLDSSTIVQTSENAYINYSAIDFQTILKRKDIDFTILKKYFNINIPDIKKVAESITSEINFKSVFISYSFKDKKFAKSINDELIYYGIKTFLWEKDAPGGHLLEDIMMSNINKHDRILFIASENSIKSKACQFELTEARKKQETNWISNIFYPIHIDNYLFEVKKNAIRPISKADEYWENIEELKRVNSTDFSKFVSGDFELSEFSAAVKEILGELKIQ